MVFAVSVGVWTQVFRLLTTSSSQRPISDTRALGRYSVFNLLAALLRSSLFGPSLGSETTCRGAVRTQLTAGPRFPDSFSRSGLRIQSRVRQQTVHNLTSGSVRRRESIVHESAELTVTCRSLDRRSRTHSNFTGSLLQFTAYCNNRSIIHVVPVPYIQVHDLTDL